VILKNNNKNLAGGANQSNLREYNERAILSLIRRKGEIAKVELAKLTGLSAQSVSVIMRGLEKDGLILKGTSKKGKVGQPSIPMRLNPNGVFTLGLKIGRRRTELVLMDFVGVQRKALHITYQYPVTNNILAFVADNLAEFISDLSADHKEKVIGLGVAMPYELWNWAQSMGAPQAEIDSWHEIDMAIELNKICHYPVSIQNDATSACAAELVFGCGAQLSNFAYIFIGFFIGGGIVLNHSIYPGPHGNSGAFGPMIVSAPDGKPSQLIEHASVALLEQQLQLAGRDTSFLWNRLDDWSEHSEYVKIWIDYIAKYIAIAIVSTCSVIDFSHFVIDGAFPENVRKQIVETVKEQLQALDLQGIVVPKIAEALLNDDPRVIGSASLPLFKHYLLDQNLLFKS
jgi:predicted NBD/HSP70 family sugar kinase